MIECKHVTGYERIPIRTDTHHYYCVKGKPNLTLVL